MDNRIQKKGDGEVLTLYSSQNKKGEVIYNDNGFSIKGAISTSEKKILTCASQVIIDCASSNLFELTLTGNVTSVIFNNINIGGYTLIIKQDAVGNHTISFPNNAVYMDGSAYAATTTANSVDVVGILYDGTNLFIYPAQNFTAAT